MKKRLGFIVTIILLCSLAIPVFAYSPWQAEDKAPETLENLVEEFRSVYELAVTKRAAAPELLQDLENLILRFENFLPSKSLFPTPTHTWSAPTEVIPGKHASNEAVGKVIYRIVKGTTNGSVWGNGIYTSDSDLNTAAVHAGLVAVDEVDIVAIRILPGQSKYEKSARNGITTRSYGSYGGSYEFVNYDKTTLLIKDPGHLKNFNGFVGRTLAFQVTGSTDNTVWGTGVYTADSYLATAAVHAGLVKPGETAIVLVEILPGQTNYKGSQNFGVSSRDFWEYGASYRLKNPQ